MRAPPLRCGATRGCWGGYNSGKPLVSEDMEEYGMGNERVCERAERVRWKPFKVEREKRHSEKKKSN